MTSVDDFVQEIGRLRRLGRDVGGMRLPFRSVAAFASQLVGRVVTTLDNAETGVDVSEETFAAPTAPDE